MMAIAGIILVAQWLAKIKKQSDVSCGLCKRLREQGGASTKNWPRGRHTMCKKKNSSDFIVLLHW